MTPYECYVMYTALKAHFNSKSYDYVKHRGKIPSATPTNYNKSPVKIFFQKLAKHKDPEGFLVANFFQNPKTWIRDIAYSKGAEEIYQEWLGANQSAEYQFKIDINKLDDDFNKNFEVSDSQHPKLIKLFLGQQITIRTFVIICDLTKCDKAWNKKMPDDLIWHETEFMLSKLKPFVKYDPKKIRNLLLARYESK